MSCFLLLLALCFLSDDDAHAVVVCRVGAVMTVSAMLLVSDDFAAARCCNGCLAIYVW